MFRPTVRAYLLVTLACLALPVLAADKPAAAAKDKDFDAPKSWILDLELIDKASGEPFANCPVSVRADNRQFAFNTDDRGHAAVEYPDGVKYLSISLKPDGYVPTSLAWRNDVAKDPIPDTFKFELERGTTIGGLVQDEGGNPIRGAKVHLLVHRKGENGNGNGRVNTNLFDYPVTTDGQGRWRCDLVPKEIDEPWIRLTHPDYLSDEVFGTTPKPPMEKLRDQTGVMVMKKGIALAGRVTDQAGKPIAGAAVAQGRDRFGSNYPQTKTDAAGNFRFAQVRPGADVVLTVTAKGFAPDQKTIVPDKNTAADNVQFKLGPGHLLRGRVVDPDGKPLAGVMIATDTWRGNRALMFRTNTDADGRFVWNEAPADEVLTDILKQGYMDTRQVPLKASDQETTITLRPPVHVIGLVTDAQTGKPVENFKVVQGIDWGNNAQQGVYWERGNAGVATTHDDGKFEFDITFPRAGHAVRVEADGYLPAESRVFKDTEPSVSLEFKLKKGQGIAGTLRTPDGTPLAGADVVLCTQQNGLYVRNGQIEQRRENAAVLSDEAGHYALPPQTGAFVLVILHDQGYAKVTSEQLAKSADITVQPWGRVTGILHVGAKPKAGETITVSPRDFETADRNAPRVYHEIKTTTDKDGRFTATRVPPGPAGVSLEVRLSEMSTGFAQTQQIDVRAGETVEVNIGGVGRPVVGKIVAPAGLTEKIQWNKAQAGFSTQIKAAQPKLPDNWAKLDPAARQKFYADWQKSPEGQAAMKARANQQHFSFKINPDGSFRTDDVPAGTYGVMIVIYGGSNQFQFGGPALATAQSTFTVPDMPGGRSDEPFDIGAIELKPVNPKAAQ